MAEELSDLLRDERFDRIDLIVSFIMRSGLQLIDDLLADAVARGARVRILTTDYMGITENAALARLLDLAQDSFVAVEVRVFQDAATSFHPKGYLFWSSQGDAATALVGSSNLSRSGLVGGIEWNVALEAVVPLLERFTELWTTHRSPALHRGVASARSRSGRTRGCTGGGDRASRRCSPTRNGRSNARRSPRWSDPDRGPPRRRWW